MKYVQTIPFLISALINTHAQTETKAGTGDLQSAMLAGCFSSPVQKLKSFSEGRAMIDDAVKLDTADPEIRFIRYMVQDGEPGFLNYDNMGQDLDHWFKYFIRHGRSVFPIRYWNTARRFVFSRSQKFCLTRSISTGPAPSLSTICSVGSIRNPVL